MERFPLYSTLLVYKEYEDKELYEECVIIRDALKEYKLKYTGKIFEGMSIPTHISEYESKEHQDTLKRLNIVVEEKTAREKATLIKLNLPVNG